MAEEKGTHIWMDGKLVAWDDARVHVVSNGFQYGFNVFEGIRCYATSERPAIFRLREHIRRLFNSAKILGFDIPFSEEAINDACVETVRSNGMDNCYIRPIAYIGRGGMGLNYRSAPVNVAIAVWFWGEYLGEGKLANGVRALTSSFMRHHVNTHMTKAKAGGNYLLFQMARTIAHDAGFDEAILLDQDGLVAEGAVEHIFCVQDGRLVTPPLTYLLGGITRDTVLRVAKDMGVEIVESPMSRDEMYVSSEVFFGGTGAEITPVVEIDGRSIANGKPGPVTGQLQKRYFEVVRGNVPAYAEWLTYV